MRTPPQTSPSLALYSLPRLHPATSAAERGCFGRGGGCAAFIPCGGPAPPLPSPGLHPQLSRYVRPHLGLAALAGLSLGWEGTGRLLLLPACPPSPPPPSPATAAAGGIVLSGPRAALPPPGQAPRSGPWSPAAAAELGRHSRAEAPAKGGGGAFRPPEGRGSLPSPPLPAGPSARPGAGDFHSGPRNLLTAATGLLAVFAPPPRLPLASPLGPVGCLLTLWPLQRGRKLVWKESVSDPPPPFTSCQG